MRAPGFWSAPERCWLSRLLGPFGWIYGRITLARMAGASRRASLPVISIGNFTAGGAGKTPTAMALAEALALTGEIPAIITRGYGGSAQGPLLINPTRHGHRLVGDEALMMAAHAMVIVARDRAAGAEYAESKGATCLILDDALQNPSLAKDISLAVIDGGAGFGNGAVVPAGPLRAPVAEASAYVSDVLLVGEDTHDSLGALPAHLRVYRTMITAEPAARDTLRGQRVLAFCGIGRPAKFHESLRNIGADIVEIRDFPDHHSYSDADAAAILSESAARDLVPVTTEKDRVRLAGSATLESLAAISRVLAIRYPLPEALLLQVTEAIAARRRAG